MSERNIRDRIRESAEDIQVPEGLLPENIERKLEQSKENKRKSRKKAGRKSFYIAYAVSAAVLLAVCSYALFRVTGTGIVQSGKASAQAQDIAAEAAMPELMPAEENTALAGDEPALEQQEKAGEIAEAEKLTEAEQELQAEKKKSDAGELYVVASDYDQVYNVIRDYIESNISISRNDVFEASIDEAFSGMSDGISSAPMQQEIMKMNQDLSEDNYSGYSTTNLQTQGVDESDIIKTDGSYIYLVSNNKIYVIDIRNGAPKEAAVVSLPENSDYSQIQEIYTDNGYLIVIAEEWKTGLEKIYYPTDESIGEGSGVIPLGEEEDSDVGMQKADPQDRSISDVERHYYTITQYQTMIYTYSLENKKSPKLLGSVGQDGSYDTSRKIGEKLYLFTRESFDVMRGETSYDWIPLAGGERIAADCIYLPEHGGNGMIISSVDINEPDKIQDNVMIVNQSAQIYVSTEAVYLYHSNYLNGTPVTEIAKFELKDGYIDAAGAASVKGTVSDTFAVNEYQGMLRILTNVNYSNEGSSLYILDEKLSLTGSLEGVAPGEYIYAARYLGDMAYFVTYRNMDPLFAVDLSDPKQPVILGELKITGYSDYLHLWEDGTMLGIGYETDPEDGSRQGVKLAMFDISDPLNMKVLDSVCIGNADYSPALDQYKTVLADVKENMIGFVVTEYNRKENNTYLLFQWQDGKFKNILTESIESGAANFRGLYSGKYFYIVSPEKITAYDRSNSFKKEGSLEMK